MDLIKMVDQMLCLRREGWFMFLQINSIGDGESSQGISKSTKNTVPRSRLRVAQQFNETGCKLVTLMAECQQYANNVQKIHPPSRKPMQYSFHQTSIRDGCGRQRKVFADIVLMGSSILCESSDFNEDNGLWTGIHVLCSSRRCWHHRFR